MNHLGSFTAHDRAASTTEPQLPAIRPCRDEPLPGLDELALPAIGPTAVAPVCCHANGYSHELPVDAEGFALFDVELPRVKP